MDYLTLSQRLIVEAGISGELATTVGNVGELARAVTWINGAWIDIQSVHPDWQWLRTSTSFPVVAGQASYTTTQANTTDFGIWLVDSFRCYPTATGVSGETFLSPIDYEEWRNVYQYGTQRTQTGIPTVVTITPNKSVGLGPPPLDGYTITADYCKAPTELSGDTDTPELPTQFHMAIVYRALMYYGGYESAPEAFERGREEYTKIMRRLERDRLPAVTLGASLA